MQPDYFKNKIHRVFGISALLGALFLSASANAQKNCRDDLHAKNPILADVPLIPWDQIQEKDLLPALKQAMAEFKTSFKAMASNPESPTFENTILKLNFAGEKLSRAFDVVGIYRQALKTDYIEEIQPQVNQLAGEYDKLVSSSPLFLKRVKLLTQTLPLGSEEQKVALSLYEEMVQTGAALSPEDRRLLLRVEQRLNDLGAQYDHHTEHNLLDNATVVGDILRMRALKAKLLGYPSYADLVLPARMAKSKEVIQRFYNELTQGIRKLLKKEKADLVSFAEKQGKIYQKLKAPEREKLFQDFAEAELGFPIDQVLAYFETEHTLQEIFKFYGDLFDLDFHFDSTIPSFEKSVRTYRLIDRQTHQELAILHFDLFKRKHKNPTAWESTIQSGGMGSAGTREPVVGIFMNLPPSEEAQPSFMSLTQIITLLHEMGHGMHEALSTARYEQLFGTHVKWDFVEFPSQLMENWAFHPDFLKRVSAHYQTGKPLPEAWIKGIQKLRGFRQGEMLKEQSLQGILDFKLSSLEDLSPLESAPSDLDFILNFEEPIENQYFKNHHKPVEVQSLQFRHVFSGPYAMGYYSYLWSSMIEKDAFDYWTEDPSKMKEKAKALRNLILSRGGTDDPNDLYRAWRGRDFTPRAFLEASGLKAPKLLSDL